MFGAWYVFAVGLAGTAFCLGIPVLCVGAIVRLCELLYGHPKGGLGSGALLRAGLLLCVPLPAVLFLPNLFL